MTDHRRMIRQSNVLGIIIPLIGIQFLWRNGTLIDDECARNIDLHASWMNDRTINFRRIRSRADMPTHRSLRGEVGGVFIIGVRGGGNEILFSLRDIRRHDGLLLAKMPGD